MAWEFRWENKVQQTIANQFNSARVFFFKSTIYYMEYDGRPWQLCRTYVQSKQTTWREIKKKRRSKKIKRYKRKRKGKNMKREPNTNYKINSKLARQKYY